MDGWDGIGMDLRVGGGIEHLTVLIKPVSEIQREKCFVKVFYRAVAST